MSKTNISVQELFDIAIKNKNNKNLSKILKNYSINDLSEFPIEYDPHFAIELFFNSKGIELWENAKNYTYIERWLKQCEYTLLQHPVTGDTIFHINPNIIQIFNLNVALNNVQNFSGVPVKYNALKEINFI